MVTFVVVLSVAGVQDSVMYTTRLAGLDRRKESANELCAGPEDV